MHRLGEITRLHVVKGTPEQDHLGLPFENVPHDNVHRIGSDDPVLRFAEKLGHLIPGFYVLISNEKQSHGLTPLTRPFNSRGREPPPQPPGGPQASQACSPSVAVDFRSERLNTATIIEPDRRHPAPWNLQPSRFRFHDSNLLYPGFPHSHVREFISVHPP